jgi:hypothetical protein
MRLSELFKFEARKSELVVPCEVTPGHSGQTYVSMSFNKQVITKVREDGKEITVPVEARVKLTVCPLCFNAFVYDLTRIAQELQNAR